MNARYLRIFISFVLLGTGALIVMSLSSFKDDGSPLPSIKKHVHMDLDEFEKSLHEFTRLTKTNDRTRITSFYKETLRPSLKKVEWILAYFDQEAYLKWINGAPLPKVEKNAPNPKIFEPNGFQTIDEWMAEAEEADMEELRKLSSQLQSKSQSIIQLVKKLPWYERHFFEAARAQVLRIYTLGVTGFDTPGTLNALKDAEVSLSAIKAWLDAYRAEYSNENVTQIYETCKTAVDKGLDLLNEQNFNEFDRVSFYKESIQPLYAGIRDFQLALGVETKAEIDNSTPAINPQARHLFSDDFFNKDFYAELPPSAQSKQRIALGKLLFFDPILSFNAQRSCASCHQPAHAYAENRPKSLANEAGQTIDRNAPGLINAVYAQDFFYDLRSGRLQDQIEHVVFSHDEFNIRYDSIVNRLQRSPEYVTLFQEAFPELGEKALDQYAINLSIASYVAKLSDYNSPFDRFMRSESSLDADAVAGFNLFMGKAVCATCHFPPSFAGLVPPDFRENETEVLGVTTNANFDQAVADLDPGRFASGKPADKQSFYNQSMKTTTVRNAELTPPYMHNGSLNTLEELVEFYDRGGGAGMGLDVPHQTLGADPLELSETEKRQLISFIKSLSHNPFKDQMVEKLPEINHPDYKMRVPGGLN